MSGTLRRILVFFLVLLFSTVSFASTRTWVGSASGAWSNPSNWLESVAPLAGDDLVFPAVALNLTSTNDIGAGTIFSSITVAGANYDITGNAFALSNGVTTTNGPFTIHAPLTLTQPQTWTLNGTGSVAVVNVSLFGITLTAVNNISLVFSSISGSGSIIENGSSTLYLGNPNFSGDLTINSGTAAIEGGTTFGNVIVNEGEVGLVNGTDVLDVTIMDGAGYRANGPGGVFTNNMAFSGASSFVLSASLATTSVTGIVDLGTNTTLTLPGYLVYPATFVLVANDFADPIYGTFVGIPEGGVVTAGTQTLRVSYVGGDGNDITLTLVVLVPTTTTLSSAPNPSTEGESVSFTAAVTSTSGTPTGNVSFYEGATLLGTSVLNVSGVAAFSTSALTVGTHMIHAVYNGDASSATSTSATIDQVVNAAAAAATTTTLSSAPNPSTEGESVTFTAAVTSSSGTPTGTVSFYEGTTLLGTSVLNISGVAAFSTSALTVGTHIIHADYNGDASFATSSSATIDQVVNAAAAADVPSMSWPALLLLAVVLATTGVLIRRV